MRSLRVTAHAKKLAVDGKELPDGIEITLLIADDCAVDQARRRVGLADGQCSDWGGERMRRVGRYLAAHAWA
mgnify:CR=1 FL=1